MRSLTFTYDKAGNRTSTTDANGIETVTAYDTLIHPASGVLRDK